MAKRRGKGEGTIFKRKDGTWQGQISLGYGPDGKRRRHTVYGATQREVREQLDKLKHEFAIGKLVSTDLTVETYLQQWLPEKARNVKPRTVEIYTHLVEAKIVPSIGKVKLNKLTPLQVQLMVGSIADTAGARTANQSRTVLNAALNQAVKWQIIGRNVVEATEPVKEKPREMVLWTNQEMKTFLATAKEHRLYAAFYLLIATGMRRGELLGLVWDDMGDGMIRVARTLSMVGNIPTLSEPKTKKGVRRVSISADVLRVLQAHRQRQDAERAYLGEAWTESGMVFPSKVGTPMNPRNFERVWYTLLQQSEVRRATIHDLRHLHVSLLVKNGIDPKTIADRVGHADAAFTLRTYTHVFEEQRRAATIDLSDLLNEDESTEDPEDDE